MGGGVRKKEIKDDILSVKLTTKVGKNRSMASISKRFKKMESNCIYDMLRQEKYLEKKSAENVKDREKIHFNR